MKYIITFQYSDEGGKEYLRNFNVDYIDGQFDVEFDNLKDFESHINFIKDRDHIKLDGSQYDVEKELTDINTDGITHIFVVKNVEDDDDKMNADQLQILRESLINRMKQQQVVTTPSKGWNVPQVDWSKFTTPRYGDIQAEDNLYTSCL